MISTIVVERGEEGRWGDLGTKLIRGFYLGSAPYRGGKDLLLSCIVLCLKLTVPFFLHDLVVSHGSSCPRWTL